MSQDQELRSWEVRWESLSEVMESLRADIDGSGIPERITLLNLINGLASKAEEHVTYFLKGFSKKPQLYQLLEDKPQQRGQVRFSKDYALSKVLDRIAFDLDVIYLAFKQRSDKSRYGPLESTLDLADKLARKALEPAKKQELIGSDTEALTYLQKSYETRVIPYAEVSLIGIPFTSVRSKADLLAIPHEVGHYIFWNGGREYKKWEKQLDSLRDKNRKENFEWTEEIFADVYGCIVAGPVIALDFQDLQLEFAGFDPITGIDEFENGVDKVHPKPILRPRIYSETLRKMKAPGVTSAGLGDLEVIADQLDTRWKMKLQRRGYQLDKSIPADDLQVQDRISKVIDDALKILEPEKSLTRFWTNQPVQNVEELYDQFDPNDVELHGTRPQVELIAKPELVVQDERGEISVVEWLEKLKAEGWTTEGPHGRD
jgi:hypothetical protein